jgi:hypothetical protein
LNTVQVDAGEEAVEVLTAINQALDERLDLMAEQRREKRENCAIPALDAHPVGPARPQALSRRMCLQELSRGHPGKLARCRNGPCTERAVTMAVAFISVPAQH